MDETLWKGTLTEGGIEIIPANFALIRTLAERGIVSSICSKNEHSAVERAAGEDTSVFLRSCNIVVEIEHDITPHLDRAIELINRTNQLNFIKSRLPEDPQQAAQELTTLLARHDIQAGLVRVVGRYGGS